MHREDIKAALRKRHGSLVAFEQKSDLPKGSVKDVLRGRAVSQTERAIASDLQKPLHQLFPRRYNATAADSSTRVDNRAPKAGAHGQIARSH